jgi:hypothetical protein
MAALDSKSSFAARASAIGISDGVFRLLEGANIDTFGKFAFVCSYQPGTSDETPFLEMIKKVLSRDPTVEEQSLLRRLYFESHTLALSDMKSRIERTDEDIPKRLPAPERQARRQKQLQDYKGLDIQGELEPAHQLVDKCCQHLEDGVLKYIPLNDCPSREQEVLKTRKEQAFVFDNSGNLKLSKSDVALKVDISSELRIKNAMIRRALAYDQSGLATFTILDKWTSKVFHVLSKETPSGYRKVTMEQVIAADKQLFLQVAEETQTGLLPVVGQPKPMDVAITNAMNDPQVIYCLLPLPESMGSSVSSRQSGSERSEPYARSPTKHDKKGKGDSKGNRSPVKGRFSVPDGCVGSANGKPLCFNFNAGRCNMVKPGKRCKFGFHLCYKSGCQKPESYSTCKH